MEHTHTDFKHIVKYLALLCIESNILEIGCCNITRKIEISGTAFSAFLDQIYRYCDKHDLKEQYIDLIFRVFMEIRKLLNNQTMINLSDDAATIWKKYREEFEKSGEVFEGMKKCREEYEKSSKECEGRKKSGWKKWCKIKTV
jgi:hypothetical protein